MGTELRLTVVGIEDRAQALAATEIALNEIERTESLLSTWRIETPLSALNRAPVGRMTRPAPELEPLLRRVREWIDRTGAAFDPRIGALIDAWDLRGDGRVPTAVELAAALQATGDAGIRTTLGGVVRLHPAAWIDAGGFGKGAALASAAAALRESGVDAATVDLGGQLLVLGAPADGSSGWTVDVAHPADRSRGVAELTLRDVSVATSGQSERGVQVGGRFFGHILDPRNGRPVRSWGSVTVVSEDPLVADILSTALYVLGPEDGLALARAMPDIGALFLESTLSGLEASWNEAMETWLVTPPVLDRPNTNDQPKERR